MQDNSRNGNKNQDNSRKAKTTQEIAGKCRCIWSPEADVWGVYSWDIWSLEGDDWGPHLGAFIWAVWIKEANGINGRRHKRGATGGNHRRPAVGGFKTIQDIQDMS